MNERRLTTAPASRPFRWKSLQSVQDRYVQSLSHPGYKAQDGVVRTLHFAMCRTMTRLLLVDGSDLMGWLVARLIPGNVEIVRATSFGEADRCLRDKPPDVAIFNLTPRHLDWRVLLDRCSDRQPVIPFLCCSPFENDFERDGPLPCRQEDYFTKSISRDEFQKLLSRLCTESRGAASGGFAVRGTYGRASRDRGNDPTPA